MKRKSPKRVIGFIVLLLISYALWFVWPRLPIITAFAAKGMCSSVFLADKAPEKVEAEDLSFFPISLAKNTINYEEKSVRSTVFGLAGRTAVYREGLGAVIQLSKDQNPEKAAFSIPDPGYDQDTLDWPKGDRVSGAIPEGVNMDRLLSVVDTCFDHPDSEALKKTLGIVVVYKDQLLAEKYLGDYDYKTKFHGWSMTKTITGAMAGLLADRAMLNLDEPTGIDAWEGTAYDSISVKDIIRMSSGLDWFENYFTISDATIMLMQSEDMLASVTDNELKYEPGTVWNYSSGDANLLSGIIRDRLENDMDYHRFAYTELFHPLGMLNTRVETDASGLFVASSYSYGSARDWARFGLLFLNHGVFNGDTILSSEWVDFMKTPAPASKGEYAGTFWLKEPDPVNELKDVPDDVFFADGFLGQRVYIIPSLELVVVRMGYGMGDFNMNDFLRELIASFE